MVKERKERWILLTAGEIANLGSGQEHLAVPTFDT